MELLITVAYYFFVRLIFFDFKLLQFNVFWGMVVFGLYASAALTEVIFLGQFTPYSSSAYIQLYTVPIAPQRGGMVENVFIEPNQQVDKGTPLFSLDKKPLIEELNEVKGELNRQQRKYDDYFELGKTGSIAKEKITFAYDTLESIKAKVNQKEYNLENSTLYAPSAGYVSSLLLRPGWFIRLKAPVMTFISTDSYWLIAKIPQKGTQRIKHGDKAEVAFDMYPGKVFDATVDNVVWATGEAQILPGGKLPDISQIKVADQFIVKLKINNNDKSHPLRFGAKGLVAIYTNDSPDALIFLRQLEIRMESYLNYVYNPFW